MRGLRDKLIQRHLADRWLPHSVAWRRKGMFRAPLDGFHTDAPTFADQLLSHESASEDGVRRSERRRALANRLS
jgi:asparagine synthase (glutamine-hydrolysing)